MKQHVVTHRKGVSGAVLALLLTLTLGLAACSGSTTDPKSATTSDEGPPTADIELTPAAGTDDVKPRDDVGLSVPNGKLKSVALKNEDGEKVSGKKTENGTSWKVTEPLGYNKTYTWSGTVLNSDEQPVPIEGSFTTVEPESVMHAQSNVGDGDTYGVAQPITLSFEQPVQDKAAVEKALSVETSKPTKGSWAWLDNDTSVHWRPKEYWKPHTDVHVEAKLYGVQMGDGVWGESDLTVDFSIGDQQVIKGNTQTHQLSMYRNGEKLATYPVSYGASSDPRRVTRSGTHVVMAEHEQFSMSNAQFDYHDVVVPWAIRISNNGEFIHGYAPTIGVQGEQNVSHGCVNMAPANAHKLVQFAQIGDPVEITGSSQALGPQDGAYYDWTIDWQKWQSLSALES